MYKKSISFLLALSVCFLLSGVLTTPGLAAATGGAELFRYSDTDEIIPKLTIANNTATCTATVRGKVGTTKITATVTLYRIDSNGKLVHEKTWSDISVDGDVLKWSDTRAVSSGYTYRLQLDATVYRNGGSENVSKSVDA